MKQEYIEENKLFFKKYLDTTFFKNWKNSTRDKTQASDKTLNKKEANWLLQNYSHLEMSIGYSCDLKCKYCYYAKYGKKLYQDEPVKARDVLKNTDKLMNFIYKNKMYISFEVFSGEPFMLPYIWDYFDILYEYLSKTEIDKRCERIAIPTNLSFLKRGRELILNKLIDYIEKFKKIDVQLSLSGSYDGLYMDAENRPHVNKNKKYDEYFYNNIVKYSPSLKLSSHPMIYSNNIEYWIENILWFLNTFGINGYLLEIRNTEWDIEQCKQMYYFCRFLANYLFIKFNKDLDKFSEFMQKQNGLNILSNSFSTIGRGIGCSIQGTLNLTMHNLNLALCHRLAYKNLIVGKFDFFEDGGYEFYPKNVELYVAVQSTNGNQITPCSSCDISELCTGSCLGENFESTGDIFTASPSVCRLARAKVLGVIKGLEDIGYIDFYLDTVNNICKNQIINALRSLQNE